MPIEALDARPAWSTTDMYTVGRTDGCREMETGEAFIETQSLALYSIDHSRIQSEAQLPAKATATIYSVVLELKRAQQLERGRMI